MAANERLFASIVIPRKGCPEGGTLTKSKCRSMLRTTIIFPAM